MKRQTLTNFACAMLMTALLIAASTDEVSAADWNAYHDLPADWDIYLGPVVVDLDRAGGKEVLSYSTHAVKMYNSSGTNYATITITGDNSRVDGIPAVGDIRPTSPDDNRPEIVVPAYGYHDPGYNSCLWLYDYGGTFVTRYAISTGVTYTQVTLADLDNNGDMEVIAMGRNDSNGKIDRVELFDWDGNETPPLTHHCFLGGLYPWNGWANYGATDWTSVCVGDMDRDGKKEVIAHAQDIIKAREVDNWNAAPNSIFTDFFELDIADFLGNTNGSFSATGFALADIQGDKNLELLVTVEDIDDNRSRLFFVTTTGTISSAYSVDGIRGIQDNSPSVADVGDDGIAEVAFGGRQITETSWDYKLMIARYTSGQWSSVNGNWPAVIDDSYSYSDHSSHPAIADVNSASGLEVIACGESTTSGYTEAFNITTGNDLNMGLSSQDDNSRSAPWVGDLDADGYMDIVYVSRDDANERIYVYREDLEGSSIKYRPDYVEWSQFQNGPRHTGLYAQTVSGTIGSDAYWSDHIIVVDDITVSSDAVLYIAPGTVIEFEHGKKITVNGSLVCDSWTESDSIVMKPNNSSDTWYGLLIDHDNTSPDVPTVIKNCIVLEAYYGIIADDINAAGDLTIDDCTISGGALGLYFQDTPAIAVSDVEISDCSSAGVLLWNSDARLSDVDVTNSGYGLYLKEHHRRTMWNIAISRPMKGKAFMPPALPMASST